MPAIQQGIKALIILAVITLSAAISFFAISYGEYKVNTTGNLWWLLFYVPHLVCGVWYLKYKSKHTYQ